MVNSGWPYLGRAQESQKQRYPFLSVCAVFPCVQTMVWPQVLGCFNVVTYVDACDCKRGLYGDTAVRVSALKAHYEHRFPALSSTLCQIQLRH